MRVDSEKILDPVDLRHVDIRKHDVHRILFDEFQRLPAVLHVARHFKPVFFPIHNGYQAFSGKFIIINYQYFHLLPPSFLLYLLSHGSGAGS